MGMKAACGLGVCLLLAAGSGLGAVAPQAVMPTEERVDGIDQAGWTARWWQWAYRFPDGFEPYRDRDGRFCDFKQEGPVWFLAGTDGSFDAERRCRVPLGRHVFLPIINMLHLSKTNGEHARDCNTLRAAAAVNNGHLVSAVVLLDGQPVGDVRRLLVQSAGCFDPFPRGAEASVFHAASDGYWLMVAPLPVGRHRLSVGANYGADEDEVYGRMIQNFEYELDIYDPNI